MGGAAALLELRGITKQFPGGTLANDAVDLELRAGEILALLGENGAGKSTLMSILYGLYRPDAGEIRLRGRAVRFRTPRDAIRHGLGMVHQHFMLISTFTVAENLVLGRRSPRPPLLEDWQAVARRIAELARRHGLAVDPEARIDQLSVGQQQRVEILKALYRGAEILILDEPTAVLTPQEVDELLAILRSLAASGSSIVFISHKLDEALRLADRIAVLRQGRLVATLPAGSTDAATLGRLMVGHEVGANAAQRAGLLEPCDSEELAGVLAHELGHVKNRDTLTMTITATLAGAIGFLSQFAFFFGMSRDDQRNNPLGIVGTLLVMILAPLAPMLVQMAISRTREYAADRAGAQFTGQPLWLARALGKIERLAQGTVNETAEQHPASAHLFIVNPLHMGGVDNLFRTHPSTEDRIRRLREIAGEMAGETAAPAARRGPWG